MFRDAVTTVVNPRLELRTTTDIATLPEKKLTLDTVIAEELEPPVGLIRLAGCGARLKPGATMLMPFQTG